ncbi:hypothetical protein C2845_PM07G33410 [Panicum miliaceum]|uniref:RING-type E3 ubiquitin transferase n=1 Tax=Panicum miliaceum TaxID=4540 RepID=A0A3L6SQH6_PANMI|nr:hypothetical protein C2845_PM07G33410 [Panicum miliaceum]
MARRCSGATAGARTTAATKPLTMFYNGGVAVFHLPQDKAEDLMKMAAGEEGGDARPAPRRANHGEELLSKMRQVGAGSPNHLRVGAARPPLPSRRPCSGQSAAPFQCAAIGCGGTPLHAYRQSYTAPFQRLESRPSNPAQGTAPLGSANPSASINDSSPAETYHLVSRPPPYDTDPRYARVQREGLVSRREKSINLAQEDSVALRRNGSSSGIEHLAAQKKRSSTENEGEYKVHRSESTKSLSAKAYSSSYVVGSEDEDVCPTCLEEYTPDNPKIITKCCHHFHLGCIYEWMERSDTCPICDKVRY